MKRCFRFKRAASTLALLGAALAVVPAANAAPAEFRSTVGRRSFSGGGTQSFFRRAARNFSLPNDLCRSAHVSQLEVQEGIRSIPVNADYCELSSRKLPSEVVAVLARIGSIHERYADALGKTPDELFGAGVRISLAAHPIGPLNSSTSPSPSTVEIDLFRDFRSENFPDRVYAHEATHWLLLEGRLGDPALTIEGDYLFHESFPDLVSSYATGSPVVDFTDPSIRTALTFPWQGTPIHSMLGPLRDFYLGRFQTDPIKECAATPANSLSANEKRMCAFFTDDTLRRADRKALFASALEKAPGTKELASIFRPERCLIHYKNGAAGLNACYMNSLGPVLISFVRSIESVLGDKPIATFLAAITSAGANPDRYSCAFTDSRAAARGAGRAEKVVFISFMRVLKTIRDGLLPEARTTFDTEWAAHGLDTWAKLDRYDRDTVVATFAYLHLASKFPRYSAQYHCAEEIPSDRGPHCQAKCAYIPSEREASERRPAPSGPSGV